MSLTAAALPLTVALPALAALVALVPRLGYAAVLVAGLGTVTAVAVIAAGFDGVPLRYAVGGWGAPLGIELAADGLALIMLGLTSATMLGACIHAQAYLDEEAAAGFWPLVALAWAGLDALALSADAFNLYVTLEVVSLAGVGLTALGGREAVTAALRYLIAGMLASLLYLLGVALLYAEHGTLALAALAGVAWSGEGGYVAMACIVLGLGIKAALFPLHFWLPPAHATAPAPVSAMLSGLVVTAALVVLLRWWLAGAGDGLGGGVAQLLGALGAAAVLWGSLQALVAPRLKTCVAYSTVAQVGFLFVFFPLAADPRAAPVAWAGVVYMALAHGLAKSALFLACGSVLRAHGHDRLAELGTCLSGAPMTRMAIGLTGVALVGLPFSGGFVGKWLLLNAALATGAWQWVVLVFAATLLSAAYVTRIASALFRAETDPPTAPAARLPAAMEAPALALALAAVALGVLYPVLEPAVMMPPLTVSASP